MCTWVSTPYIYRAVQGENPGLDRYLDKYLSNLNDPENALMLIDIVRYDPRSSCLSGACHVLSPFAGPHPFMGLGPIRNSYLTLYNEKAELRGKKNNKAEG